MTRYLGIDYGSKRVGLAISDALGLTAQPLEVVSRPEAAERVRELVDQLDIERLVMGLPTGLAGGEGGSAEAAREFAERLGRDLGVDVVLVDERFTSRIAESALLESGMKRRRRRDTVDKVAAALILQSYLDSPSRPGNPELHGDVEHPEQT